MAIFLYASNCQTGLFFFSSEIARSYPGDYVLRCLKQEVKEIHGELKL
jgi:hypothetical protein